MRGVHGPSGRGRSAVVVAVGGIGVLLGVWLAMSSSFTSGSPARMAVAIALLGAGNVALAVMTRGGTRPLLLLLFTVNAFLTPMNVLRVGSFFSVSDTALLAAAPIVIASRFLRPSGTPLGPFRPFLAALGAMAGGGTIATAFASDPIAGLPHVARFVVSTIGVMLVVAAWAPTRAQVRVIVWAFTLGASVSVVAGLVSGFSFVGRAVGLTLHPNHLGMASMMAAGSAFGLALTSSGKSRRVAHAISLLLVAGVLVSGSRAAFFGLLVAVLAFFMVARSARTVLRSVAFCTPLVLAVLLGFVHLPGANAFDRLFRGDRGTELSDEERAGVRIEALEQIRARPVHGSGFENSRTAHSLYLQLWASAGLVGLGGLLALVVVTIRLLMAAAKIRDRLVAAMVAAFFGYLAGGVASNILWDRYVWLHMTLAIALLAARRSAASKPSHPGPEPVVAVQPSSL